MIPRGEGAILFPIFHDGTAKPIAFASQTLIIAESQYVQLKQEASGIIFGVHMFHTYL